MDPKPQVVITDFIRDDLKPEREILGEVADALGYRSGSSVTRAVARVESGTEKLRRTATKLERSLH